MRVGIILDNPKRDLRGVCLLAHELAVQGATPFIIPMYAQYYDVPLLKLDALVLNYARKTNLEVMREYRKLGIKLFVLDTEGGLIANTGPRSPSGWAEFIRTNKFAELLDGYFFWGEQLYHGFKAGSGFASGNLHVTGNPRYDVAHSSWRELLPKAPSEKPILVNTNFAAINPKFASSPEQEAKNAEGAGLELNFARRLIADQGVIMNRFVEAIEKVFAANPKRQFLLRAHPFEKEESYIEAFKKFPNVRVESKGEIFDVVAECGLVVHVNCTTAVDAFILGVPAVTMNFLNTPLMAEWCELPNKVSYEVRSVEELNHVLENPQIVTEFFAKNSGAIDLIQPMFGPLDGRAAARMAKVLISKIPTQSEAKISIGKSLTSTLSGRPLVRLAIGLVSNVFGSALISSLRNQWNQTRASKSVSTGELRALFEKIRAVSNSGNYEVHRASHPLTAVPLESFVLKSSQ